MTQEETLNEIKRALVPLKEAMDILEDVDQDGAADISREYSELNRIYHTLEVFLYNEQKEATS